MGSQADDLWRGCRSAARLRRVDGRGGKEDAPQYSDVFGNGVKSILGYSAPEASTTQFTVNGLGQRTQITDPRALVTTYTQNTRGLQTSNTSPDAGTKSGKYDRAGNLRFSQDANQAAAGQVTFTNYDFAARPLVSGQGAAAFAALNPDLAPGALETTSTNWLVVRAYDAKPSTAAFPWSVFSAQISLLTLSNVSGRLAATASKSGGSWQITLYGYDTESPRVLRRLGYGRTAAAQALNPGRTATSRPRPPSHVNDLGELCAAVVPSSAVGPEANSPSATSLPPAPSPPLA